MSDTSWFEAAAPWLYIGGAGILGRLMYHAKQVQLGKRKPFSVALFLDIPVALATGWAAYGLAVQYGAVWEAQISVAIIASYFGPYGLDTLFAKWKDSKNTKGEDDAAN